MTFLMTKTAHTHSGIHTIVLDSTRSFGVDIGHTGRDDVQQLPGGIAGQQGHQLAHFNDIGRQNYSIAFCGKEIGQCLNGKKVEEKLK